MQHHYFPFDCRIITWCFTGQWFKLADLLFLHFSSWVVSLLKSWSELIGFCDAWSVHIRFVCVTVSDVLVGGNNVFCTRSWCCREHFLETCCTLLMLPLPFEHSLRNLPYALDAMLWICSSELAIYDLDATLWNVLHGTCHTLCCVLNIFYGTCHTLLMLRFEYSRGNLSHALDATLWFFFGKL